MFDDRLRKLARHLDKLSEHDSERARRDREIELLRRRAAADLHAVCAAFVETLNTLLRTLRLELSPAEFSETAFHETAVNLFQVNASGRVIQLAFQGTEPLVSTENWNTPYTLEGTVHWYNREMLERDDVREHRLYYCLEGHSNCWRFYDDRTHRDGPVNAGYLAGLMEDLVGPR